MHSIRTRGIRFNVSWLLIFLTCFSVGAEDLFALTPCGEDADYALFGSEALNVVQPPDSTHSSRTDRGENDHDCLCCCHHIVVGNSFRLTWISGISYIESGSLAKVPSVDLLPLCLPPRA